LAESGNKEQSYEILSTKNYLLNKKIYTKSIINLKNEHHIKLARIVEEQKFRQLINLAIIILMTLSIILMWIFLFKVIKNYQKSTFLNNKELKSLISRLNNSNQSLERFAYACSHEFKEPIRNISNLLKMFFKKNPQLKEDQENAQLRIYLEKSLNSMNEITDGLLFYYKVEHDHKQSEKKKIELNILLEEVRSESLFTDPDAQITISKNLPQIKGEYQIVKLLFKNIINNAIKFKQPGKKSEIAVKYEKLKEYHQFSIKDNGVGIKEGYHDKVFDLFFRTDAHIESSGIGLSLCKRIIELYQGSIFVKCEGRNKGCEFVFKIKHT
jgi:light-regulated signal transduction histidine kinase (bacteriophytochrome)